MGGLCLILREGESIGIATHLSVQFSLEVCRTCKGSIRLEGCHTDNLSQLAAKTFLDLLRGESRDRTLPTLFRCTSPTTRGEQTELRRTR